MRARVRDILPKFAHLGVLVSLVLFFVVTPFFSRFVDGSFLLDASVMAILVLSVYICSDNKRYLVFAIVLALPTPLRQIFPHQGIEIITLALNVLFFGFVIYVLLRKLILAQEIDADSIYSAIIIYFLMGLVWGLIYTLVEYVHPRSFTISYGLTGGSFYSAFGKDMIYYSFVTLTTLGYGDILPLSPLAKYLSTLEAMMAQIYLAVLVAHLVGMHISQARK